jgi:hypothetical protein
MAEKRRQRHDGEDGEQKQERVSFRYEPFARENRGTERQKPQKRVVPDFPEQKVHGSPLAREYGPREQSATSGRLQGSALRCKTCFEERVVFPQEVVI